ncbi:hypothetical protein PanWU01x14_328270, partial [Parasponia andersonii]
QWLISRFDMCIYAGIRPSSYQAVVGCVPYTVHGTYESGNKRLAKTVQQGCWCTLACPDRL